MRIRTALLATLITACGSSTVSDPDASVTVHADARPAADAAPGRDAAEPDRDANPRDGDMLRDAFADDAAADDATAADAAPDPCGPIPRAALPAAFTAGMTAVIARCNPELTQVEAAALAGHAGDILEDKLADTALVYDATLAGQCGCDVATLACDAPNPLTSIASCAGVLTGTITVGNACIGDRCAPGSFCRKDWDRAHPLCEGVCEALVPPGDECNNFDDLLPCTPGYFCRDNSSQKARDTCEPLRNLGEQCDNDLCAGDFENDVLLSRTWCVFHKQTGTSTCTELGRAGAPCRESGCHPLYFCNNDNLCQLRPRMGEPCALGYDADSEASDEIYIDIFNANFGCMTSYDIARPSAVCIQTGTTTGVGVCSPTAALGGACGAGRGLTARCERGSHCEGFDFMHGASTCVANLADGEACDFDRPADVLGPECTAAGCFGDPAVCSNDIDTNRSCVND